MKKLTYFLVLMSAFTLMSVSCCKPDEDITDPTNPNAGLISLDKLNGTWKSNAYIYNGVRYKYNTTAAINANVNELFRTFTFYSALKTVDYTWTANSTTPNHYDFTKDVNAVEFLDDLTNAVKERYTVTGYSSDTLRLNFTFKDGNPTLKTGTYVLTK